MLAAKTKSILKDFLFRAWSGLLLKHGAPLKNVIWIIGSGRSGTTWVSEILNHDKYFREIFEPFHPVRNEHAEFLCLNEYKAPQVEDEKLQALAQTVFSGKIFGRRTDLQRSLHLHKGLLIKDIFASLFVAWVKQRFPNIRTLLIIRHPFSVALSTQRNKDWIWMTEPKDFLRQQSLVDAYLSPFQDLIQSVSEKEDYFLNQVTIWSVVNYVLLKQGAAAVDNIIYYESLKANAETHVPNLLRFARPGESQNLNQDFYDRVLKKPSKMVGPRSRYREDVSSSKPWENELTQAQLHEGIKILAAFELDTLYADDGKPNPQGLRQTFGLEAH